MRRVEVVAAVVIRDGRVLLSRRPEGVHLAGLWEFPGGKVHPEESEAEALIRELEEELGVSGARIGECLCRVEHAYPEKEVALAFFRTELPEGVEPRAVEVAELCWADGETLGRLPLPPADRPLVELLRSELT
ncbi:MAG: (deoxy)nucleoside triphosphate pyrophosphohydrolase [Deltaproteobacteria bacterium]|nr:(deoxy)nucleoside triphosphate pyrophosphohydrolase [Deltaproteobacteria bacterium]